VTQAKPTPTITKRLLCLGVLATLCLGLAACVSAEAEMQRADAAVRDLNASGRSKSFPDEFARIEADRMAAKVALAGGNDDRAIALSRSVVAEARVLQNHPTPPPPKPAAPMVVLIGPTAATQNQLVAFEIAGNPEDEELAYDWEWGDGKTEATASSLMTHRYTNPGQFLIEVRVTNARNQSVSAQQEITVTDMMGREVLGWIGFPLFKATLNPQSPTLQTRLEALLSDPSAKLTIVGHAREQERKTDPALAKRRATEVGSFFVEAGIAPGRLEIKAPDSEHPAHNRAAVYLESGP
jgi:outer membrane protein OmpA-like peptidoglycan-associated protein